MGGGVGGVGGGVVGGGVLGGGGGGGGVGSLSHKLSYVCEADEFS